jgi:lysophospholipase L1-like esterase
MHMNAKGMSLFSRMLAARVIESLRLENAVQ